MFYEHFFRISLGASGSSVGPPGVLLGPSEFPIGCGQTHVSHYTRVPLRVSPYLAEGRHTHRNDLSKQYQHVESSIHRAPQPWLLACCLCDPKAISSKPTILTNAIEWLQDCCLGCCLLADDCLWLSTDWLPSWFVGRLIGWPAG